MKKFTSLLIGCSLALAGATMAQPPEQQSTPKKKGKTPATEAQPGAKAAKPQERPAKQTGAIKERGAPNEPGAASEPGAGKGRKARTNQESATGAQTGTDVSGQATGTATKEPGAAKGRKDRAKSETEAQTETDVSGQPTGAPKPGAKQQAEERKKGKKEPAAAAKTSPAPPAAAASPAPTVPAAGQQTARTKGTGAAKKPDPQKVQQIKTQHANFRAQPKPQQVPAVSFNQSYRIQGSEQWQGPQYEVFRSYRPEWRDQGWYRSRYSRVELIGGGYYYFNNGYWYPAWGYDPSAAYYAYDGPIYVGQRAEPPDKVIADVQAVLQEMGYYRGEVDGLLGPLTREALTAYQAEQGLMTTAVIDQPTLDSLGMG
jgi:Putative peptidoglycan binding domain